MARNCIIEEFQQKRCVLKYKVVRKLSGQRKDGPRNPSPALIVAEVKHLNHTKAHLHNTTA